MSIIPVHLFPAGPKGGAPWEISDSRDSFLEEEEERRLVCRDCGNRVTRENWRIAVSGQHVHVFFNPHGLVFEIGCFDQAPGAAAMGPPSTEFTWFAGSAWRVAVCRACLNHLGWRFEGECGAFFGLILSCLAPESG